MKEVSAGGVVFFRGETTQLLMIVDRCHKWTLPKGKVEKGESYSETAIREIQEETGIEGEIVKPLEKVYYEYYHPVHGKVEKEVYYYLVEAKNYLLKVQESEINQAKWLSLEEAWEKQKNSGYDNNLSIMKQALRELGYENLQ
ncbi:NUDIX hydrolase [Tepidibacillus fermentans]|uniref:NUDIX domain-containing protein n=1 Tax=Tepidibacillus fermentans TaxID=1281767 RepID=A0A4R3KJG3_9BACI|nr:NUDIX domain-containing protein [Tepidibacillus fermentans]TCS83739.1 NUDIX domain-containing protein [Tepidibacillus fermentans]